MEKDGTEKEKQKNIIIIVLLNQNLKENIKMEKYGMDI